MSSKVVAVLSALLVMYGGGMVVTVDSEKIVVEK